MRGRAVWALGALAFTVTGAARADASSEDRVPAIGPATKAVDACAASFPADAFSQAPSEADVAPGQAVAVDVRWRPAWFTGEKVDVLGCVAANGHFVDGTVGRGVDTSTGLWVHRFAVPAGAVRGVVVCQAAIVIGAGAGDAAKATRSDPDCFTVTSAGAAPVAAPEAASADASGGKETTAVTQLPATPSATRPEPAATNAPIPSTKDSPAASRTAAAAPAPSPATAPAAAAAPTKQLPHTGAAERLLVAAAGVLLAVGGWATGFGAGTRRAGSGAVRSLLR